MLTTEPSGAGESWFSRARRRSPFLPQLWVEAPSRADVRSTPEVRAEVGGALDHASAARPSSLPRLCAQSLPRPHGLDPPAQAGFGPSSFRRLWGAPHPL